MNKSTHGTMGSPRCTGTWPSCGSDVMIVLAMITYAAPGLFGHDQEAGESRRLEMWGVLAADGRGSSG